jgi:hypothetical protein
LIGAGDLLADGRTAYRHDDAGRQAVLCSIVIPKQEEFA